MRGEQRKASFLLFDFSHQPSMQLIIILDKERIEFPLELYGKLPFPLKVVSPIGDNHNDDAE